MSAAPAAAAPAPSAAAPAAAAPAAAAPAADRPKNNVQVGTARSKAVYADVAKHLLHGGEKQVELSALGSAINECVSVAEMLKNQGMVKVTKITTSRNVENARRASTDKIAIIVVKSPEFDVKYAEQQKLREERKASQPATKA